MIPLPVNGDKSLYQVIDATVGLSVSGSSAEHINVHSSPNVRDRSGLGSNERDKLGAEKDREGRMGMFEKVMHKRKKKKETKREEKQH